MGILVSMGGFIFGYDTGQISGFLSTPDYINRFGSYNPKLHKMAFTNVRSGLIVGMLSIGTLIGSLVAAPISDRVGRKWSISGWCVVLFVGIIVQITSPVHHWWQVMMGRWVAGLSVGSLSLLVPLYMGETSPRHIRGSLVSCYQLFVTLGIFTAYCICYGTEAKYDTGSWRIPLGITIIWGLILGIGMAFFPESPRMDWRKGRVDDAKRTMMKFYGVPENHRQLHYEFLEIDRQIQEERSTENEPWYGMFVAPSMPYRLIIGMILQMLQQLTGANYYFYYGTTVFDGAGISNTFVTQMILGGVNVGTTFFGLYFIEHFGRRKSLIYGALWMFVCFIVFATVGHFCLDRDDPTRTPGAGKVMVCFSCFFITGYASTWGPMVWALISEIYPTRYRARAMALPTASNWLWNFLLSFFTPFIVSSIDFRYGYVFAGCLALAAAVVFFGVIEGRNRTLEEIDAMYLLKVTPWKSASFQLPMEHERVGDGTGADKVTTSSLSDDIALPHQPTYEESSLPMSRSVSELQNHERLTH